MEILYLIGFMCITVLLVNATPIMIIRDKFGLYEIDDKNNSKFKNRIIELLSCAMCLGFWVGFVGSIFITDYDILPSILYASIISIGSEIINKLMRYT